MASQMINNYWRNSRLKWAKFMVIRNTYPNHGHSSDFLCFLLRRVQLAGLCRVEAQGLSCPNVQTEWGYSNAVILDPSLRKYVY